MLDFFLDEISSSSYSQLNVTLNNLSWVNRISFDCRSSSCVIDVSLDSIVTT